MKEPWRTTAHELRVAESLSGRRRLGRFSIEGLRLCERALRAGAPVERALVAAGLWRRPDTRERALLRELADRGVRVDVAPDEVIGELCGGRELGRVLALVRGPEPLPPERVLAAAPEHAPVVLLCDVLDPGNVGALVRTALAAGAAGLIAAGVSDPWHPRALRTSMGSTFRLSIARAERAETALAAARAAGARLVGALARGGISPEAWRPDSRRPVLVLGSEASGLPEQADLDDALTIPMPAGVDSFSVNAAAAILLYRVAHR